MKFFTSNYFKQLLLLLFLCAPALSRPQSRFFYSSSGYPDLIFNSVSPAPGGDFYLGGAYQSDTGHSNVVRRMDENGDVLWTKAFGGKGQNGIRSIATGSDSSLLIGVYVSNGAYWDIAITNLDPEGNIRWSRRLDPRDRNECYGVAQTNDGGVLAAGYTKFRTDPNMLIAKIDSKGDLAWANIYKSDKFDVIRSISPTHDGNFIIGGSHSKDEEVKPLAAKIDADGNIIWAKELTTPETGIISAVTELTDGNYAFTGEIYFNGFAKIGLFILSPLGKLLTFKIVGGLGNDGSFSINKTSDNDVLIAGTSDGYKPKGKTDMVLVKFNNKAEIKWFRTYLMPDKEVFVTVREIDDKGLLTTAAFSSGKEAKSLLIKMNSKGEACLESNGQNPILLDLITNVTVADIEFIIEKTNSFSAIFWKTEEPLIFDKKECENNQGYD